MGDDQDRTSAIGLFNFAHSYCSSAIALERANVRATHANSPVYYLYYHSIELYLKSFLRAHNISTEKLAKKYSHRTRKTTNKAKKLGLVLRNVDEDIIDYMHHTNAVIEARYIVAGYKPAMPTFESLSDTCRYLHDQICETAYTGFGGTRRPVLPN